LRADYLAVSVELFIICSFTQAWKLHIQTRILLWQPWLVLPQFFPFLDLFQGFFGTTKCVARAGALRSEPNHGSAAPQFLAIPAPS
jgi:hypothetical protein